MLPQASKTAAGRLIGYVPALTKDQGTDPQTDEVNAAGCTTICKEHASGADVAGETLVYLDRLARSASLIDSESIAQTEVALGMRQSTILGSLCRHTIDSESIGDSADLCGAYISVNSVTSRQRQQIDSESIGCAAGPLPDLIFRNSNINAYRSVMCSEGNLWPRRRSREAVTCS